MFEIEKKYLVKKPDSYTLAFITMSISKITQTYLKTYGNITERRIRMRQYIDSMKTEFTYTEKKPISELKREENESPISLEEYEGLLKEADPYINQIKKTRHCFRYKGQLFELDIYDEGQTVPFSNDCAIMEIELPSEDTQVMLPDFITVLMEVTDDKRFKNKSIAEMGSKTNTA